MLPVGRSPAGRRRSRSTCNLLGSRWPAELSDDSVLVQALASESSPTNLAPFSSRPGSAHATIVGPQPMSVESFSAWAQRALLGTANPAIDDVLAWTLPHRVTELELPTDARASHHARTAMRSIADGLSCVDDVLLATSELTANALQHGGGSPRLTALRTDHSVIVALTDRRPDVLPSVLAMRGAVASSGRGMAIVEAISTLLGRHRVPRPQGRVVRAHRSLTGRRPVNLCRPSPGGTRQRGTTLRVWPGEPAPLGATFDGLGTNIAVFSNVAEAVSVCFFDADGNEQCVELPERSGAVFHGYFPDVESGRELRAAGPRAVRPGTRATAATRASC